MQNQTESKLSRVSALREMISRWSVKAKSISFLKPWDRLPVEKGSVLALCSPDGGGKTELVMQVIEQNREMRVAWIEKELTIYPFSFAQKKISMNRVLFVEAGKQEMWSASHCIRSQLFDLVVVRAESLCEMDLRRLQLAAEKAQVSVILLTSAPIREGAWPLSEQLAVLRDQLRGGAPCVSYA